MQTKKHFFKKVLVALTLAAAFPAVTLCFGFQTVSVAHAAVSADDVMKYLTYRGYVVSSITRIDNSENYCANTKLNGVSYLTTVIVRNGSIIGHDDMTL